MYEHEREYEAAEGQRANQVRRDEPSGHEFAAAATGRVDALSPDAALGVQRSAGNAAMQASVQKSKVRDVVSRSSGGPVPADIRQTVEANYGPMPGDARWHSDAEALESAREVGAYAYASGRDIVAPADAPRSVQLEEAFHLAQQLKYDDVAQTDLGNGVLVSDNSDRYEREAQDLAARHSSATPSATPDAAALAGVAGADAALSSGAPASAQAVVQRSVLDSSADEEPDEEPEEEPEPAASVQRSVEDSDEEEYAEE